MLNSVALMGRITADPELKRTANGIAVCSFCIAVNRTYVKAGEDREADFINIITWRGTAEFVCKYFTKGQLMALEGAIQTRNYEDKNGNKRTSVDVVASNIHFAESKNPSQQKSTENNVSLFNKDEDVIMFSTCDNDDFIEIEDVFDLPF